jgi:hypothetical protein
VLSGIGVFRRIASVFGLVARNGLSFLLVAFILSSYLSGAHRLSRKRFTFDPVSSDRDRQRGGSVVNRLGKPRVASWQRHTSRKAQRLEVLETCSSVAAKQNLPLREACSSPHIGSDPKMANGKSFATFF